ncbi:MAG: T9SS type A sorting domain-containing protein [bacterium]|nr:T9SS type A sorting domain-containing protein [bacterium]
MKKFIIHFLIVIAFVVNVNAQHTVTNTLTNFRLFNNGTQFSFDIYSLKTSVPAFRMGSTSYWIKFNAGLLSNAVISNVNPKYTVGSITNSYNSMQSFQNYVSSPNRIGIQIFYAGGPGDTLTTDPGMFGYGELIVTVAFDILQNQMPNLVWDNVNTGVVNTQNQNAGVINVGGYNGPLPVELSSFTSVISRNNVTLNWATLTETNNNGFDVERKNANGEWTKISFIAGNGNSAEVRNYSHKDNNLPSGTYNYRLKQQDFNGNFEYMNLQNEVLIGIPDKFELSQNYPNPFNPNTKINFSIPVDTRVSLKIYDVSGKLVSILINNELRTADYYSVNFQGADLSSGTYFYSITTESNIETKKMTLVK